MTANEHSNHLATIDIVIAAKNESRAIAACLDAIAKQDYPSDLVRVIVVNHNSHDDTGEIADALGAQVIASHARSIGGARNTGIRQGSGEFVAFLDAHCVPEPAWLRNLLAAFVDDTIGGCQGSFDYKCICPRARWLMQHTMFASDDALSEKTVYARHSTYPWVVTGNSMFRRKALEKISLFNEDLFRCEDADLSWRVVLAGYLLEFAPKARVMHVDHNSWIDYIKKHFHYGQGAAQLAHSHALLGKRTRQQPIANDNNPTLGTLLLKLAYWAGYTWESTRIRRGAVRAPATYTFEPLDEAMRPSFTWTESSRLALSRSVIYWRSAAEQTTVVNLAGNTRLVLDGSAHHFFEQLRHHRDRFSSAQTIARHYGLSLSEAETDLEEFVDQLVSEGVLARF